MSKNKPDMRAELLKLMQLKKNVLSAEIAGFQVEKTQLEDKMKFYERLTGEWAAEGGFQQSQSAADGIEPVKTEVEKTRLKIERAQQERLKMSVAMRTLSP